MIHPLLIKALLILSQPTWFIGLIIAIYCWVDRRLALQTIFVMGFCIILNVALKVTFKVPIAVHLGYNGFAFPSGHTQFSTVFYLWMAYQFNNRLLNILILPIIVAMGTSLVVAGFHSVSDVLGGAFVAVLVVIGFAMLVKYEPKMMPWCILGMATLLMCYIPMQFTPIPVHAWIAYGIILLNIPIFMACKSSTSCRTTPGAP